MHILVDRLRDLRDLLVRVVYFIRVCIRIIRLIVLDLVSGHIVHACDAFRFFLLDEVFALLRITHTRRIRVLQIDRQVLKCIRCLLVAVTVDDRQCHLLLDGYQ